MTPFKIKFLRLLTIFDKIYKNPSFLLQTIVGQRVGNCGSCLIDKMDNSFSRLALCKVYNYDNNDERQNRKNYLYSKGWRKGLIINAKKGLAQIDIFPTRYFFYIHCLFSLQYMVLQRKSPIR